MMSLWSRFVAFGFHLLYNQLTWLYDPVSWVVSLGRWRKWQRTALSFLPAGGRVLEVGSGPGHLLLDLLTSGYRPTGLDLSPAMLRRARRRLQRGQAMSPLCRGQAQALPFAARAFDAIVITFPTPFVYDPACIDNLVRVLREDGRLVVVTMAIFRRGDPASRCLEWLFRITGQRGPAPDLAERLAGAGLIARHEIVEVEGTGVRLVVGRRTSSELQD